MGLSSEAVAFGRVTMPLSPEPRSSVWGHFGCHSWRGTTSHRDCEALPGTGWRAASAEGSGSDVHPRSQAVMHPADSAYKGFTALGPLGSSVQGPLSPRVCLRSRLGESEHRLYALSEVRGGGRETMNHARQGVERCCVKRFVRVLTPGTWGRDFIWKEGLCRWDNVQELLMSSSWMTWVGPDHLAGVPAGDGAGGCGARGSEAGSSALRTPSSQTCLAPELGEKKLLVLFP